MLKHYDEMRASLYHRLIFSSRLLPVHAWIVRNGIDHRPEFSNRRRWRTLWRSRQIRVIDRYLKIVARSCIVGPVSAAHRGKHAILAESLMNL